MNYFLLKSRQLALSLWIISTASFAQSLPEMGMYFDGQNDVITVPLTTRINFGDSYWTVEVIFNAENSSVSTTGYVLSLLNSQNGQTTPLRVSNLNSNDVEVRFGSGSSSFAANSRECTHVAFSNPGDMSSTGGSSSDVRFVNAYKNGIRQNFLFATPGNTFDKLLIGTSSHDPRFFRGSIKEIRLWDVLRSPAELAFYKDKPLNGNEIGLVGYWKLNSNTQIVTDYSSNNNDGYLGTSPGIDDADPILKLACTTECTPIVYFKDSDGDGFGNPNNYILSCVPITGYVLNSTDCNDGNFAINPGAVEKCDGIDNNCNGEIDEVSPLAIAQSKPLCPLGNSVLSFSVTNPSIATYIWEYVGINGNLQANNTESTLNQWGAIQSIPTLKVTEVGGCNRKTTYSIITAENEICCSSVNANFQNSLDCYSSYIGLFPNSYWPTNKYSWRLNGTEFSTNQTTGLILPPGANTISLTTSTNGYCQKTIEKEIAVSVKPELYGPESICRDTEVEITSNLLKMDEEENEYSYNWMVYSGGEIIENNINSIKIKPLLNQSYINVSVNYYDNNKCYKQADKLIRILDCTQLVIFNSPTTNEVKLRVNHSAGISYIAYVYSSSGILVSTIYGNSNQEVSLGQNYLPGNLYLVKVQIGNEYLSGTFVK